ncbi:hypothetical protein [Roseivirga sp.]|uniref:hypothetical protein n=1 Tax=Roseivirga sp. TaxID=1964215 RepID=UPI003B8BC2CA
MDFYKFLIGMGLILLSSLLTIYQNKNGVFRKKEKYTQNDVRLFFAIGIGVLFGIYYLVIAF